MDEKDFEELLRKNIDNFDKSKMNVEHISDDGDTDGDDSVP